MKSLVYNYISNKILSFYSSIYAVETQKALKYYWKLLRILI